MQNILTNSYEVRSGEFQTAGDASASIKRKLKQIGIGSTVLRRIAVINVDGEHSYVFINPEILESLSQREFMRKVVDYINQNMKEKITLQTISAYVGYNPKYFCRLFKEYTQRNFNEYVCMMRINHAKKLMQGNLSVSYIAGECGFYNLSYFAKKFREYVGMNPVKYRAYINNTLESDI